MATMTKNQILEYPANCLVDRFHAIVDGKRTGLAGCAAAGECQRAAQCLRSDARLSYRAAMKERGEYCRAFILA